MEACYINTAHPDFLNGHRAMAIINEKMSTKNPQGTEKGRGNLNALTTNPLFDTDAQNAGFFGTFFNASKKKKAGVMEPVKCFV